MKLLPIEPKATMEEAWAEGDHLLAEGSRLLEEELVAKRLRKEGGFHV